MSDLTNEMERIRDAERRATGCQECRVKNARIAELEAAIRAQPSESADDRPTPETWELADGDPIWDEYSYMDSADWLTDGDWDEPVEAVHTTWRAVRRELVRHDPDRLCKACKGEGKTPSGAACGKCLGNGDRRPTTEVVKVEEWTSEANSNAPLTWTTAAVAGRTGWPTEKLGSTDE